MSGFLLDTNVLSELRRPKADPRVVAFIAAAREEKLFVSEVTFAEIRFGIEQAADPERRAILTTWVANMLRPLFAGRTLAVSEDVLLRWRLMIEVGRKRGHTFSQPDLFIAAIAAEAGLIVVTRDTTHFIAAGVPVLDPWTGRYNLADGKTVMLGDAEMQGLIGNS